MPPDQSLNYDLHCLLYGGGISFVAHVLAFRFLSPWISRALVTSFGAMPWYTQSEWNDRVISTLNALVSVVLSVYTLMFEPGVRPEAILHDSYFSRLACGIVVGYMFADLFVMYMWCRLQKGELLGYMFHHAATVYAYYYISAYGVLCYFGMLRLFAELSTPFVNLRWCFDVMGIPRKERRVLVNGVAMVATFFGSRILAMPFYWTQIYLVSGSEDTAKLGHIQLIMYIPCFILDVLNIIWFSKMCKGLLKAVKAAKTSQANGELKPKSV